MHSEAKQQTETSKFEEEKGLLQAPSKENENEWLVLKSLNSPMFWGQEFL